MPVCSLRQRVNVQGSCSLAIGGLAPTANLWMAPRVAEPEGAVPITPFRACNPKRANILTQADPAWALLNRRLGLKPCTLCVRPRVWVSVRSKATSAKQGPRVAQTAEFAVCGFSFRIRDEPRTFYNGVGFVKAFLATLPPPRAGRGVKGDPALCAGSFIEDP